MGSSLEMALTSLQYPESVHYRLGAGENKFRKPAEEVQERKQMWGRQK